MPTDPKVEGLARLIDPVAFMGDTPLQRSWIPVALERAKAILAAGWQHVPEGWVVVPREEDAEMWRAGRRVFQEQAALYAKQTTSEMAFAYADDAPKKIYRAMLAAAEREAAARRPQEGEDV